MTIFNITGPSGAGKSLITDILVGEPIIMPDGSNLQLAPVEKYVTAGQEYSTNLRGEKRHFVSQKEFDKRNKNGEFLITYHGVDPTMTYGITKESVESQLKADRSPIIITNLEGALNLLDANKNGLINEEIRTLFIHAYQNDLERRIIERPGDHSRKMEKLAKLGEQLQDFYNNLNIYDVILHNPDPPSIYENGQIQHTGEDLRQIFILTERIKGAIRAGITKDNYHIHINELLKRLLKMGSEQLSETISKGKSVELEFDNELLVAYSKQQGMLVDYIVSTLPTHVIGYIRHFGRDVIIFNRGKKFADPGVKQYTTDLIIRAVNDVPQFKNTKVEDFPISNYGLVTSIGVGIDDIVTFGYRDPIFLPVEYSPWTQHKSSSLVFASLNTESRKCYIIVRPLTQHEISKYRDLK